MTDEELYRYDDKQQNDIRIAKPWDRDPKYFTNVKISLHALLKMLRHARKGGQLEIMGMLLGKLEISTMIVMDAFALPVEGTETRVNAHAQAYEYMTAYVDAAKDTDRPEPVIGWYHSHPGYGCWLSGIDVGTQMLNQQFQDPFVAIVVDPIRTVSTGKVDIGAFRCYPKNFKPADELQPEYQTIPMDKIEDFGVHCKKYYSLEISYFKSDLDAYLLECLGNKYWYNTLGTTSLTTNSDYTTRQLTDLTGRLEQAESRIAKGGLVSKLAPREQPGSSSSASAMAAVAAMTNIHQHHSHQQQQQQQQQQHQDFLAKVTGDCAKAAVDPITGLVGQIIKDSLFNLNKDNQKANSS